MASIRGTKGDNDAERTRLQAAALHRASREEHDARVAEAVERTREKGHDDREGEGEGLRTPPLQLIESLDGRRGSRVPVVAGEVLVPTGSDAEAAHQLLRRQGFAPVDRTGGTGSRLYRGPEDRLRHVLLALHSRGLRAGANHFMALSWPVKMADTPEWTDNPPAPRTGKPERKGTAVAVIDTGTPDPAASPRTDGWLADVQVHPEQRDQLTDLTTNDGVHLDPGAGHGTFVIGVVKQVCPDAVVRSFRGLTTMGGGTEDDIVDAIHRARRWLIKEHRGRGVLNLSFGGNTVDGLPPVGIEQAINSLPSGVVVVAASGNSPTTEPLWPAACQRVHAVASLATDGTTPSTWCTHGHWVGFSTVGEGVVSTFVDGVEDPDVDPQGERFPRQGQEPNSYGLWTGTSFAAPRVSAWLADYLAACPTAPAQDAVTWLRGQGVPVPAYGYALNPARVGAPAGCDDPSEALLD